MQLLAFLGMYRISGRCLYPAGYQVSGSYPVSGIRLNYPAHNRIPQFIMHDQQICSSSSSSWTVYPAV